MYPISYIPASTMFGSDLVVAVRCLVSCRVLSDDDGIFCVSETLGYSAFGIVKDCCCIRFNSGVWNFTKNWVDTLEGNFSNN